jgi:hypothetical protein
MMNLEDQEVQLLILALRFWRAQRRDGSMRRTDPAIPPQAVDTLLARLEAGRSPLRPTRPFDDPLDPFGELFSR